MTKALNILLISSGTPTDNSPKMAFDMVEALKTGGHDVDLLLKYPVKNDSVNTISVFTERDIFKHRIINSLRRRFTSLKKKMRLSATKQPLPNYFFFHTDEAKPPVASWRILNKIQRNYDVVLVFFWQGMLTSKSIHDIYQKVKVPVFLIAADMFPMTGGCSYFWDCRNFETGCGKCPALGSDDPNDYTSKIFSYKQNVYNNSNVVFLGNSWMAKHAVKSKLFKHIDYIYPVINQHVFTAGNKDELKARFNLTGKKVLFIGSVNVHEERKGFKYLVEALTLLSKSNFEYTKDIVLVIAGGASVDMQSYFSFPVITTGHLSYDVLAQYYAAADIYLSSTIQDAGPMMVNQALMCGTPVVAFEMGTACDVVNNETGYLAAYKDTTDFCFGITKVLNQTAEEKEVMSIKCREMSISKSSYSAFEQLIFNTYTKVITTN